MDPNTVTNTPQNNPMMKMKRHLPLARVLSHFAFCLSFIFDSTGSYKAGVRQTLLKSQKER